MKYTLLFILLSSSIFTFSQNKLTGSFSALANQTIRLVGFNGFDIYPIDSVKASAEGAFSLNYAQQDYGMAYLASTDNKSFIVVLVNEAMQISGESFAAPETIRIRGSRENEWFGRYATEHPRREQALSAWDYLEKIYQKDSLFAVNARPKKEIERERNRIKDEDRQFLAGLPSTSYVSWYLPVRKLVSSAGTVAQYRTDELPATIEAFRALDYTDARIYKSGLLREALEAHFWLIENSGRSLDSVYVEMNKSIDRMMPTLITDERKFNEITDFLFKLLEKRSLFGASEYLALKVLNEQSCTLNNDLAAQLESYRAMKKGNVAPDIVFEIELIVGSEVNSAGKTHPDTGLTNPQHSAGNANQPAKPLTLSTGNANQSAKPLTLSTGNSNRPAKPARLSDLRSAYTLVVFGASWCPSCQSELSQLSALYPNWKQLGVEVLFVSLDEKPDEFRNFARNFLFISYCDYNKWKSSAVIDYHVFATPTLYLLDANRKIILRPTSVRQVDAWVDWYLVKNNKN